MPFCARSSALLAAVILWATAGAPGGVGAGQGESPRSLPVIRVDNGPNSAAAQRAHYVVLVSLDGFRWDYARRDGAVHLLALGRRGAWAPEGMLPAFPSLTFPNHLSIVTGLYPGHHGIVANNFLDEGTGVRFAMTDPQAAAEGGWYGGTPLWSLAESQGMRSAALFWPGSEAKIAGYRPSYYLRFDDSVDEDARVRQVLAWLRLPAGDRPHLITLYDPHPDHEGHQFGPDAPQTRAAVRRVDAMVGRLEAGIGGTGLPVDLVVVSDHGMVTTEGGWVTLDQFTDLGNFQAVGALLYGKAEEDRVRAYNGLKHASSQFVAFRRRDLPAGLNYRESPRAGDPVVVPTGPFAVRAHGPAAGAPDPPPSPGMHGFDPRRMPEMKAIFFAAGPDIVAGSTVKTFENVNLYPWIAHLLGLKAPRSDGSLNVLAGTLRDGGGEPAN